jgi:hypothetical protein
MFLLDMRGKLPYRDVYTLMLFKTHGYSVLFGVPVLLCICPV